MVHSEQIHELLKYRYSYYRFLRDEYMRLARDWRDRQDRLHMCLCVRSARKFNKTVIKIKQELANHG